MVIQPTGQGVSQSVCACMYGSSIMVIQPTGQGVSQSVCACMYGSSSKLMSLFGLNAILSDFVVGYKHYNMLIKWMMYI